MILVNRPAADIVNENINSAVLEKDISSAIQENDNDNSYLENKTDTKLQLPSATSSQA